jgi:predicted RNase H-like HicB family nuclease
MKYTAILHEAEEGGYWATCAEVPEANGQGETQQEAVDDLKAAIELVLQYKRDHGQSPEPTQLLEIDVA